MNHGQHLQESTNEPWYRQFWPWFIMALPASVVIAGISTWMIAAKNSDSLVVDDYYKQGLGINRQLAEDSWAQTLGVTAQCKIDPLVGELVLHLKGDFEQQPTVLQMKFIHPTRSPSDFEVELKAVADNQYVGEIPRLIAGRWYVQLSSSEQDTWRLKTTVVLADGQLQWHMQ